MKKQKISIQGFTQFLNTTSIKKARVCSTTEGYINEYVKAALRLPKAKTMLLVFEDKIKMKIINRKHKFSVILPDDLYVWFDDVNSKISEESEDNGKLFVSKKRAIEIANSTFREEEPTKSHSNYYGHSYNGSSYGKSEYGGNSNVGFLGYSRPQGHFDHYGDHDFRDSRFANKIDRTDFRPADSPRTVSPEEGFKWERVAAGKLRLVKHDDQRVESNFDYGIPDQTQGTSGNVMSEHSAIGNSSPDEFFSDLP